MSKTYGKKVYNALKENKLKSISILLEQEEEENQDEENVGSDVDDIADALSGDSKEESEDEGEVEQGLSDQDALSDETAEKVADELGIIVKKFNNISNELGSIENVMSDAYSMATREEAPIEIKNESINKKFALKDFIFEKDESIKRLTKAMEDFDDAISKSSAIVDKFKKGVDINMNKYVESAINAFKNFDNKFSKHDIVKQGAINVLILNSGSKADAQIKEFEELFHIELYNQFGIEDERFMIPSEKTVTAAGAMKQG